MEITWPAPIHKSVFPVFLPFMGCPKRCVFCSQHTQTGQEKECLEAILDRVRYHLRLAGKNYDELAFYGGTFTALPQDDWCLALDFAKDMIASGYFHTFRCSTRPDHLSAERCSELAQAGCSLVELGIQTFDAQALKLCGRDYDLAACEQAMRLLEENGITIGVQLMPGAPFAPKGRFLLDTRMALDLGATVFRFYPCMVFAGTPLEFLWRQGRFAPISLEVAVSECARAWLLARGRGARVIRMGLAEQPRMMKDILAGPTHEAFGNCVMSEALFQAVSEQLAIAPSKRESGKIVLKIPVHAQGYIWGWQGNLRSAWQSLGIEKDNVRYWQKNIVLLE